MRTELPPGFAQTLAGATAERVLRSCVHCGMCNATCPTYQLTGDELDGPRGRIYLIKQMLEGRPVTTITQSHLDRCLGCRACETTCPSGVEYHKLYDVGRDVLERKVTRTWRARALRFLIRGIVPFPARMRLAARLGRIAGPFLPRHLRIPDTDHDLPRDCTFPDSNQVSAPAARTMLLLAGCVQAVFARAINAASVRVFQRVGIRLIEVSGAGCCGALQYHLDDATAARASARRNIDAWWEYVEAGIEAIVVNASGCASHLKDYDALLADDPQYAAKARRIAALIRDPVELLGSASVLSARRPDAPRIAVHEPCTLQHALRLTGKVTALLRTLGYEPQAVRDAHLCCGSAGAYSILQPQMAGRLRDDKLAALMEGSPTVIYTGNIGCWAHLKPHAPVPVRHWIQAVDDVL